jgi:hypothetical protein
MGCSVALLVSIPLSRFNNCVLFEAVVGHTYSKQRSRYFDLFDVTPVDSEKIHDRRSEVGY